jgi:hypothetical protein
VARFDPACRPLCRLILQSPVKRFPANAEERSHLLASLSGIDQLAAMGDLLAG